MHPVARACRDRDADAFVHVGTRTDATVRYLTDYDRPGRVGVVAVVDDATAEWTLFVPDPDQVVSDPDRADSPVAPSFSSDPSVTVAAAPTPLGEGVATALADADVGSVLAPRSVPHDVAVYVESRGIDLRSTDAVGRARETKTAAERERVQAAAGTAAAGIRAAATTLADAAAVDGRLEGPDGPLTPRSLRYRVAAAVAAAGGLPGPDTRVAGPTAPDDPLSPGTPVLVECCPQVDGYHARLARTLVPEGTGGVERRAHVALRGAHEAALAALRDGESVAHASREVEAEVAAYGLEAAEAGVTGVGLAPHERPSPTADIVPAAGTTLVVGAGVGGDVPVRLADPVVVTDEGVDPLVEVADALDPGRY